MFKSSLQVHVQNLETELTEWFRESRSQLKTVSRYMIQAKARSLAKKSIYEPFYPDIKEAKFSQKWVDGFMSRHNLIGEEQQLLNDFQKIM